LVEFAEVVEIVDVVAVALGGRVSMVCPGWRELWETHVGRAGFAAGGKPDVGDTNVLVGRHRIVQAVVVLAISRNIPLKALEQSVVLRSRFFCAHVERCLERYEMRKDGNVETECADRHTDKRHRE
jgi:hypothetical protein